MRFRVPALALAPDLNESVRNAVTALPAVKTVRLNETCGSVVIEYDPTQAHVPDHVRSVLDQISIDSFTATERTAAPDDRTSKRVPSTARKLAGRSLLVAGLVGWMLPLIPGTPFFIAGVILLGKDDPLVQYGWDKIARLRRRNQAT